MSDTSERDAAVYRVVVNHEEQYSLWPEGNPTVASANAGVNSRAFAASCLYDSILEARMRSGQLRIVTHPSAHVRYEAELEDAQTRSVLFQ